MASDEFITRPKSRQPHKLSARAVAAAKSGRHGDGAGLWLIVAPGGAKKWVFRFSWARRPTEMGLGGYPAVSLAEAREKAAGARKLASAGTNPIQVRKAKRQISQARQTFGECALALIAAKASEWRNVEHRR
jgi:Arm DNA-binding domain